MAKSWRKKKNSPDFRRRKCGEKWTKDIKINPNFKNKWFQWATLPNLMHYPSGPNNNFIEEELGKASRTKTFHRQTCFRSKSQSLHCTHDKRPINANMGLFNVQLKKDAFLLEKLSIFNAYHASNMLFTSPWWIHVDRKWLPCSALETSCLLLWA